MENKPLDTAITIRLPRSIIPMIDEVLLGGEIRSRFIRTAVINEVMKRKNARKGRRAA